MNLKCTAASPMMHRHRDGAVAFEWANGGFDGMNTTTSMLMMSSS